MLKKILELEGAKKLQKEVLKKISGGGLGGPITGPDGGGGNGNGNGGERCVCLDSNFTTIKVSCDSTCSDGSSPFSSGI